MNIAMAAATKELERDMARLISKKGPHALAALYSINQVGTQSRTKVSRATRTELEVSAKSMNKRVKFFRATLRRPRARLWAGTKIGIALFEGGTKNKGVSKRAPTASTFIATMKSGHKGLFYRSYRSGGVRRGAKLTPHGQSDLPIAEVRITGKEIAKTVNEVMPPIARAVWREKQEPIYRKDLDRRLKLKGWK